MNASELTALMGLAGQARAIDGAYQAVDPQRTTFLARLGNLQEQASRGSITSSEADQTARELADAFRTEMQAIVSRGRFMPNLPAAAAPNPREQAASVLGELHHAGVEVTAHPGGLTLRPASKVPANLRVQVTALRDHLLALLDVLFIGAPNVKA